MNRPMKRRDFLKETALAGLTAPLALPAIGRPGILEEALHVACIGAGGMGAMDRQRITKNPRVRIVALCDVDGKALDGAAKEFSAAKTYADWRRCLDQKGIDAVTVSIPDHMHAAVTINALRRGKHVYCQKPLTHSVHEARQVGLAAKKAGVVTQMGIQVHSTVAYRRVVKIIQSGVIGKVREVHSWTNRPLWRQGADLRQPEKSDPVPPAFKWDFWLGVAPKRPFATGLYHHKWHGWLDFGTGALGDMGCHILDPVVWSLNLDAPSVVWSEGPVPTSEAFPKWSTIRYRFPGTEFTADKSIEVTWYDGRKRSGRPPRDIVKLPDGKDLPPSGSLFLGEKGQLFSLHSGMTGKVFLFPEKDFKDYKKPDFEPRDHWLEWTNACLGEDTVSAPFEYSAPLTETVLLGNVALRFPGEKLKWDTANLRFPEFAAADRLLKRQYRKGWEVEGLS